MVSLHDAEDAVHRVSPPGPDGTKEQWRVWARNITIAFIVWVAVTGAHMLWACGFLLTISPAFSGFAVASDVTNQEAALALKVDGLAKMQYQNRNEILATVISGQIITMGAQRCEAVRDKNIALASSLDGQLSDLQTKYMAVNGGQIYPLQPCP